jgi:hypothetical protein
MPKGYPIDPYLQTSPIAESSITHRHIQCVNCGEIPANICSLPVTWSPVLTMNSVAEGALTD